jgi:REP element-mobilizing transposase RayT
MTRLSRKLLPLAASRIKKLSLPFMPNPIVIAYHLVWTAYGWWLPNDPRGSMSNLIRNDILKELGELHYGRKRIQPASRDIRDFYDSATSLLKYPQMTFKPAMIAAIAESFREVILTLKYTCYACAIMPDHVHILIRKHKHLGEEMISNLQRESHLRLRDLGLVDMEQPVWGGPGWKVFLDHPDDIWRVIRYIQENPIKAHLPSQQWDFARPYDNWPLHPGHSPKSPYARRLRGS